MLLPTSQLSHVHSLGELSLLTTPSHVQNLHLLRYTFVTVTHYSQMHRLIPQHTKQ